jgi:hypothetical protein
MSKQDSNPSLKLGGWLATEQLNQLSGDLARCAQAGTGQIVKKKVASLLLP